MSNSVYQTIIDGNTKSTNVDASGAFNMVQFLTFNKYGLATMVFVSTLCISLTVEPEFLLVDNKDIIKQKQLGYIRAIVLSIMLSATVLYIPVVAKK